MTEHSAQDNAMSRTTLTAAEWFKVRGLLHEMMGRISGSYRAKFDASDIVQQTLLEASHRFSDYRGTTDAEFQSWLRQMLSRNLLDAIRQLRAQKRSIARETQLEGPTASGNPIADVNLVAEQTSPSLQVARGEEQAQLLAALDKLPADQRLAISLHHLQGWKTAEVAAHMNRSTAALAGLLHRGLRSLRQYLNET